MIGHSRHRTGRATAYEHAIRFTKNSASNNVGWTQLDPSPYASSSVVGLPTFTLEPGLWQLTLSGTHTVNYTNPLQANQPIGPMVECITLSATLPLTQRRIVFNGIINLGGDPQAAQSVPQGTSDVYNGLYLSGDTDRDQFSFGPDQPGSLDDRGDTTVRLDQQCSFTFFYDSTPGGLTINYQVTAASYLLTCYKLA